MLPVPGRAEIFNAPILRTLPAWANVMTLDTGSRPGASTCVGGAQVSTASREIATRAV